MELRSSQGNSVAVIGAGMAGLACAGHLVRAGWRVRVFDKSAAIGGRLATRRRPGGPWNHGAARVQARTAAFARVLRGLCAAGSAEMVAGAGEGFTVCGSPDMRSLLEPLAAGLDLQLSAEVQRLGGGPGAWRPELADGREVGVFDAIVVAIPAPQAERLLTRSGVEVSGALGAVEMSPRWTLLLGFTNATGHEGAVPPGRVLAAIERQSLADSPSDRDGFAETWVVHATRDWSVAHLELSREEAAGRLLRVLAGFAPLEPDYAVAHRWRYAFTERSLECSHLWLSDRQIGLCGDWCLGERAEDAYLSGTALAERLGGQSIRV